jgi:magnesium transporter
MLTAYVRTDNASLQAAAVPLDQPIPAQTLWVDLKEPTGEEVRLVNFWLGIEVPTREEMQEIELSSRLYHENNATYMTATLLAQTDTEQPVSSPVTFVIAAHRLVTLRYVDPNPFRAFAVQIKRPTAQQLHSGEEIMGGLLDAIVDRLADILERVQHDMDTLSSEIFGRDNKNGPVDYEEILRRIGRAQGLTSRARESLVSIGRLLTFLGRPGDAKEGKQEKQLSRSFRTVSRDVLSLSDHSSYLANNINFLLDATLGLINNEQTSIIKIFSVAAVVFLPPTLIASIYGMNFRFMPELQWWIGYPMSIALMIASVVGTYWFFKHRKWL